MQIKVLIACKIESLFDAFTWFSANLEIRQTCLFQFSSDAFRSDFPSIFEVRFISKQDHDRFIFFIIVTEVDPLVQVVKCLLISS